MARVLEYAEDAERELTSGKFSDFPSFAVLALKIQTKGAGFIPFRLNRSQWLRETMLQEMEEKQIAIRIWEAKARQLGCSTHIQGRMFWKCVTNRDEIAVVAAHDTKPANEMFTKAKMFYDNLPDGLKPVQKYNNREELDLRHPTQKGGLRSRFVVATATNVDSFRSFMARQAHLSEVAFYRDPEGFFLGAMQSISDGPGTMVYAESTCRGSGDFHHSQYLNSRVWWEEVPPWMTLKQRHKGSPDSDFYALFTPWFLLEEYQSKLPMGRDEFYAGLDGEERELLERFPKWVMLESLQWRRRTLQTKCGGSVEGFRQEYPATDEEAFSTSGSPVFVGADVAWVEQRHVCWCPMCLPYPGAAVPEGNDCPPHEWAEIRDGSEGSSERLWSQRRPAVEARGEGGGRLSIWKRPEAGKKYVVSVDVSQGSGSRDWCVIHVQEAAGLEQVAEWRGKVELPDLVETCLLIAVWYGVAVLAPERNGVGAGMIPLLERTQYWNLYRQQSILSDGVPSTSIKGWLTSSSTKPAMVGFMQQALKDHNAVIRSRVMIDEMRAYTKEYQYGEGENQAKMSAPAGKNDDALMAGLIATAVSHYIPSGWKAKAIVGMDREEQIARALDSSRWDASEWERFHDMNRNSKARARGWEAQ